MTLGVQNYSVEDPLHQFPTFLARIIDKKVNRVALGCFETIVDWFLTVFSCFSPAYHSFYEKISVVNVLEREISQGEKDQALISVFSAIKGQIPIGFSLPRLVGSMSDDACQIRSWMQRNPRALDCVMILNVPNEGLTVFPSEVNFLKKLERVDISSNPITMLPIGINCSKLKKLNLKATNIASLPDNFNPPNLESLILDNTPIRSLPDNFNPPKLKVLDLGNSLVTALPERFNPHQLEYLYLNNCPIASFPIWIDLNHLIGLDVTGTDIQLTAMEKPLDHHQLFIAG